MISLVVLATLMAGTTACGSDDDARAAGRERITVGVIPIVEFHFNTPLDHRNDGQPDPLKSTVNFTGGVQIELFNRARLGFAVGVPLTGPRPYDLEFISSFNWRF